MYVQAFVLQQFVRADVGRKFVQQGNRNGVTYERDDHIIRQVEHNKYREKLKTIVNILRLGTAAYSWNKAVLSMAHRQGAHRHITNNS